MIDSRDQCLACRAPLRPQDLEHCGSCSQVLAEWSPIDVRTALGEAYREGDESERRRLLRILATLLGCNRRGLLK